VTGWAGGSANRTWQRGRRRQTPGQRNLREDVAAILAVFRESHGWVPGAEYDPYLGRYVTRGGDYGQ
jgi:hypothetical protein